FPYTTLFRSSLRGNLTDDINFPVIIFTSLQAGLDAHFEMMGRQVDTEHLARAISGMLLSYILFPHETALHELSEAEKNRLAQKQDRKSTRLNSSHVSISY